jgi:hypothetical protein
MSPRLLKINKILTTGIKACSKRNVFTRGFLPSRTASDTMAAASREYVKMRCGHEAMEEANSRVTAASNKRKERVRRSTGFSLVHMETFIQYLLLKSKCYPAAVLKGDRVCRRHGFKHLLQDLECRKTRIEENEGLKEAKNHLGS